MPQVPYNPVQTVGPSQQGIGAPHVDAPAAAFGEPIAEGIRRLGTATEGASNELFGRAIALQQLNNETEARQADADYMIQAGQVHADFNALQGQDRAQGYPAYQKNLEDLRTKIRGNLSNPMAQKLYDASSLSTMGRTIFNGAGAAASANKDWTIGTAKASLDLAVKTIGDNPTDEGLYQQKLEEIKARARDLSAQHGLGPDSPQERLLIQNSTSAALASRIIGLSKTQPFAAKTMLDTKGKAMTQDDQNKVTTQVTTAGRAVGSANIANGVYAPDKTLAQMETEAREQAAKFNPDDPLLATHAVQAVQSKYNQDHYAVTREQSQANGDAQSLIIKNNPNNMQDFFAVPGSREIYNRLSPTEQTNLPGKINRYNKALNEYDNEVEFRRIMGMANSDDPEARAEFLDLDSTKRKISQPQMRMVDAKQHAMREKTEADPRVQRAVGLLRGAYSSQMETLGIFERTQQNKNDYDHFTGALQSALEDWKDTHGKPPTYKDIVESIGPQLFREKVTPGIFWDTRTPFFKEEVPEKMAASIRGQAKDPYMTDDEVFKVYTRMRYHQLYGNPPKIQDRAK